MHRVQTLQITRVDQPINRATMVGSRPAPLSFKSKHLKRDGGQGGGRKSSLHLTVYRKHE